MRVALIGNMNNNFFSIMRYFRDLDIDAHLFMYENEYEHFMPEKDTYNIEKYNKYIHRLSIKPSVKGLLLLDKKRIKGELANYDFFIGCGLAPAIFLKLGMRLDILVPYDDGVEYTTQPKLISKKLLQNMARRYVVTMQTKAIKENTSKIITSAVQDVTNDTINRLNLSDKLIKKYVPMVYLEKPQKNHKLDEIVELISSHDLVIFCHTRHSWQEDSLRENYIIEDDGKGLDKLMVGYKEFMQNNPTLNPLLIFFEYGEDLEASKELISQLKIKKNVKWLPLMARKDILQLISHADIVVDSLSASMWSGVGWEGLSQGKVIMQNIIQTDREYYDEMGHELPFMMKANKSSDVEKHLNSFIKDREYFSTKAKENQEWFDKYAGIGLAKEYQEIVEELYLQKV